MARPRAEEPLVVFMGRSDSNNTDVSSYLGSGHEGSFLDRRAEKMGILFDGVPIPALAIRRWLDAGANPVYVLGKPDDEEILESCRDEIEYLGEDSSLGDKILALGEIGESHPDQMVTVATKDMVGHPDHLRRYLEAKRFYAREGMGYVVPMVDGRELVHKGEGFRRSLDERIYRVRADASTVDYNAFPSVHGILPSALDLRKIKDVTDVLFQFRGLGSRSSIVFKALPRLMLDADRRYIIPDMLSMLPVLARSQYGDRVPFVSLPGYEDVRDNIACLFQDPSRVESLCKIIRPQDWISLAMDIDDPREAECAAKYHGAKLSFRSPIRAPE